MTPKRTELLFCGALLVLLAAAQSVGLSRPFLRQHESVGTELGKHARNHLKFGLGATLGLKLDVSGPSLEPYGNPREYFYPSHPPLPALLLAGVFRLTGVSEPAYRLFLILVSAAAVLLFRRISARLVSPPYDRLATVAFAFFPAFAYYSVVTGLFSLALLGILSGLLSYLRWTETGRRADYALLAGSTVFACSCAWPGYYLAPALLAAHAGSRRPGLRKVAALLGVNVAVFGLYLLHLWAADPQGLDPLRTLLEMGLSRSSAGLSSFPRYVLGELREIGLMFTLPAVAMAAVWLARFARQRREGADWIIAGLFLLGLDELLFARVAGEHEYYSYFLAAPLALALGRGLAAWLPPFRERSPRGARAAVTAVAAAFLLQAGWTLERRLNREGGYEFYHRLGLAVRDVAPPESKVLLLTDHIPFYTPYYGDRFYRWYDGSKGELVTENTGGRRPGFSEEDLLAYLRENPDRMDLAVTADREELVRAIPWLSRLDDTALLGFGVHPGTWKPAALLADRYGPPREHGGFRFWNLRRR